MFKAKTQRSTDTRWDVPSHGDADDYRARITNTLSLIVAGICLVYIPVFMMAGLSSLAWANIPMGVFYLTVPPLLLRRGYRRTAKFVFIGVFNSGLAVYGISLHPDLGVYLVYFPVSVLPLVLFSADERRSILAGIVISLSAVGSIQLVTANHEPWFLVSASATPLIFACALFTAMCLTLLVVVYFQRAHATAQRVAADSLAAKEQFLANISHEVRTPMNGVLGMAEMLQDPSLDASQRESCATVLLQAGQTMMAVLNDILDFSKLEAGALVLEKTSFDLRSNLQNVVSLFQSEAQAKGVSIAWVCEERAPEWVVSDVVRVRQVLTNLVANAVKFTNQGSVTVRVTVDEEAAPKGAQLRFCVEDTGAGIPTSQLATIFERFTQGDETRTRRYGGSGLGLAISNQLVRLLGGAIGVQSVEEQGSTFWFTLPLVVGAPAALERGLGNPERPSPKGIRNLNILLAEDNEINGKLLVMALKRAGLTVDWVTDGQQALDAMQRAPYDLILMDCQMPVLDGYEATSRIRQLELPVRPIIIALTASVLASQRAACLAAGMDDYIAKPVSSERLIQVLARRVEGQRQSVAP